LKKIKAFAAMVSKLRLEAIALSIDDRKYEQASSYLLDTIRDSLGDENILSRAAAELLLRLADTHIMAGNPKLATAAYERMVLLANGQKSDPVAQSSTINFLRSTVANSFAIIHGVLSTRQPCLPLSYK
jgi:hypothetical protein